MLLRWCKSVTHTHARTHARTHAHTHTQTPEPAQRRTTRTAAARAGLDRPVRAQRTKLQHNAHNKAIAYAYAYAGSRHMHATRNEQSHRTCSTSHAQRTPHTINQADATTPAPTTKHARKHTTSTQATPTSSAGPRRGPHGHTTHTYEGTLPVS